MSETVRNKTVFDNIVTINTEKIMSLGFEIHEGFKRLVMAFYFGPEIKSKKWEIESNFFAHTNKTCIVIVSCTLSNFFSFLKRFLSKNVGPESIL